MAKFVFHPKIGVIYLDQFHGKFFVVSEIVFLELSFKICRGAQSEKFELWLDKVLTDGEVAEWLKAAPC